MEIVDGYDHQPGVHCGAAALRNVTAYYDWTYSEAAAFGIGGGAAFVLYEQPDHPWVTFRASPLWLERAFFERLGVPHLHQTGDEFSTAWDDVTGYVDGDDPVVLFLDPTQLPYLPEEPDHLPPHVAVLVGYDDESVELSDAAMDERMEIPLSTLEAAWSSDGPVALSNEYLVVTRARRTEANNDAAAAGLRQAATYMLDPMQVKRDARGPGEEGLPALRSFADYLGTWPDLPDTARPLRAARRSIHEHRDETAYRGLFAEALEELGQRVELSRDQAGRMADAADEWRLVSDRLGDALAADQPRPALFQEAASTLGDVADVEAAVFEAVHDELGGPDRV